MSSIRLKMIKQQRIGVLILIASIIVAELLVHKDTFFKNKTIQVKEIPYTVENALLIEENPFQGISLEPFNPNDYTLEDWQKIGFTEKQAEVILKYKQIVGGSFTSKEQIKKCFVISDEKYQSLEPYLLLPEKDNSASEWNESTKLTKKKYHLISFNPNSYTLQDWQNIGFTQKQAEVILKYKQIIGGNFTSKEQIKKCFVISDEKYKELASYIQLPESKSDNKETIVSSKQSKEINTATYNEILSTVGDEVIAKRIVSFRNGLGGFVAQEQLNEVYGITAEMKSNLLKTFTLEPLKVKKIDLQQASEEELQKHLYLRKYKNKIIEARKKGEDPLQVITRSDPKYSWIIQYIK